MQIADYQKISRIEKLRDYIEEAMLQANWISSKLVEDGKIEEAKEYDKLREELENLEHDAMHKFICQVSVT